MKKANPKNMTWIDYKYNYLNPIGYAKGIRDELRRGNTEINMTAFLNLDNPNSNTKRVNKEIYKRIKEILKEDQDSIIVITGSRGNSVSVENKIKVDKQHKIEYDYYVNKNPSNE